MREIVINDKRFEIVGEITKLPINPWTAKITGAGLEYSSFQGVNIEEWHDFRSGIGRESALPEDTSRTWWLNGVDVSTPRSAVLNPLVNTAGSFGVAPVKIIDFQGGTYAIGHNQISKWSGSAWTSKHTGLANPIDAIVITDDTDEYLIVSSATTAKYTTDGETWVLLGTTWTSPTGATGTSWNTPNDAIDDNTSTDTYVTIDPTAWGNYLELTISSGNYGAVRYYIDEDTPSLITLIDVDIYYDAAWHDVYQGSFTTGEWITKAVPEGIKAVTKARIRGYNSDSGTRNLHVAEFDFGLRASDDPVKGYLASYGSRLYWISTTGNTVTYSNAGDIDAYSGTFSLTGNFGTLYSFFEGKLLADGTPCLYFTGTQGLYSLDTSAEQAYKQKVEYPPLTYSGHVGEYWNANIWVATGYGILKVSSSMATFVGPDQEDGLPSGYQGYIYDFTTVNNWLVYCVNGGSTDKSSILKRNASVGGNIQVYTTSAVNNPIACVHHSPSSMYTNGRLWWGEGTSIKYCMFPDITSNVKQISTYQYATASDSQGIILPKFRKLAAIKKVALNVSAVTKSCDTDEHITLYHDINETGSWTELGTYKTSPKPTILEFGGGLGLEFYLIQFACKLQRGTTNTNSPELESLAFAWRGKPTRISSWTFRMICTAEEYTELEAIYDTATLVTFYPSGDTNQTSHNVGISMMPQRFAHEGMGGREGVAEITVEEVYKG